MCFYGRSLHIHVCRHGQSAWRASSARCSIKQHLERITRKLKRRWSAPPLSLTCRRWRSRWGPWTGPRDGKGVVTSSSPKSMAGGYSTRTHRMTSSLGRDSSVFNFASEDTLTTSRSWSALSSCPSPRSMHRCHIEGGIFYGFLYIVFYCQVETQARGFDAT
jgi:hypothetical protein